MGRIRRPVGLSKAAKSCVRGSMASVVVYREVQDVEELLLVLFDSHTCFCIEGNQFYTCR